MADKFQRANSQFKWSKASDASKDRWIHDLGRSIPKILVFNVTNSFGSVAADTVEFDSITVTGIKKEDMIIGWKWGAQEFDTSASGELLNIISCHITADNTVSVTMENEHTSALTADASLVFTIAVIRMGV